LTHEQAKKKNLESDPDPGHAPTLIDWLLSLSKTWLPN